MRKVFSLLATAVAAITVVSCDNQPEVIADPITPRPDSLDFYVEQATKTKDAKYQYYAGSLLLNKYTHKDSINAIEFLEQAASQEFGVAENALGNIYSADSTNSYYNINKAIEYYKLAVKHGSSGAMLNLADKLINGVGIEKDYERALKLRTNAFIGLYKLAENGDVSSQHKLGTLFIDGRGFQKNYKEGIVWEEKAVKQGYPAAMLYLGWCYEHGNGVEKDSEKTFDLFQKAAESNDISALFNLGICYANGNGTDSNLEKAFECYKKAAEFGHQDAMFKLALAYTNGSGTEINYSEAFKWYKKLADLGNLNAQNNIGAMYEYGHGVIKSAAEAFRWYKKAAEGGSAFSQRVVGLCYVNGNGVEADANKGFEWLLKAAKGGDKDGAGWVAVCYEQGIGTTKNPKLAAYWRNINEQQ